MLQAKQARQLLLRLQEQHGNQYVQRALELAREGQGGATGQVQALFRPVEDDEGTTDLLRQVQSLELGAPGDKYEQEADRVANQVVQNLSAAKSTVSAFGLERGPQDAVSAKIVSLLSNLAGGTQPAIAHSGHGTANLLRVHALDKGASSVMREVPAAVGTQIEQSKGQGAPLPASVQKTMSAQLGHDFSQVRVKSGDRAAGMSQQLGARAFTHGSDIWLGHGESASDTHLMAHELTHVVQQGAAPKLSRTKGPGLSEAAASSGVVQHLQRVARGGVESKPYREAISKFRREHNGGDLATLQRQVLEAELARDIAEKDSTKSVRMAACGGSSTAVKFPSMSKIAKDSVVDTARTTDWTAGEGDKLERSGWIMWNKDTDKYKVTGKATGDALGVDPGSTPADAAPEYCVGHYHTHPPLTDAMNEEVKNGTASYPVGPSDADKNFANGRKNPGIVRDFKTTKRKKTRDYTYGPSTRPSIK